MSSKPIQELRSRSTFHQTRREWLLDRQAGLGSSDASAICGHDPWRGILEVFTDKMGLRAEETGKPWLAWGHRLQEVIGEAWSEETGRPLLKAWGEFTITRHADNAFMMASFDAICPRAQGKPGPGIVELKNSFSLRANEWSEELPTEVLIQVAHQLAVSGLRWASVGVLIGGNDFKWLDVDRDDEMERLITAITHAETQFWMDHVLTKTPPELSENNASDKRALGMIYPEHEAGKRVQLNGELRGIATAWDAARKEKSAWTTTADTLANKLRAAIGDAEVGEFDDGATVHYKTGKDGIRRLTGRKL